MTAPPSPAGPRAGAVRRFLASCLASPGDIALTAALLLLAAWILPDLVRWLVIDAVWRGSPADCAARDGACWLFLRLRAGQILYGGYPEPERWRLAAAALIAAMGLYGLSTQVRRQTVRLLPAGCGLILLSGIVALLIRGGVAGLPPVPTALWGGLSLTVIVASWTIVTALPLGLCLALARRSGLPVLAWLAAGCIDLARSLPLVGILFLAIVLFPLFVPPHWETDRLMRALLAFTLFNAANLAEMFRGGLQAVPPGQIEAGLSLGLSRWRITNLIVIPQALPVALPGVTNSCISVIKETTIVLIVGLFDFLGVLQAGLSDPDWLAVSSIRSTSYIFAALVFWAVCFSLSRYSLALERRLNSGPRR